MLVYGDHGWDERPQDAIRRLRDELDALWRMPGGLERHGALVGSFIQAGELAQGLADATFAERETDARVAASEAPLRLLIALAQSVARSWNSGFGDLGTCPLASLACVQALDFPDTVRISLPEGYAFYALYPETYVRAGQALADRAVKIIGLRSIGTSLAAAVAAGAHADYTVTVRPIGHPFERKLALADSLKRELLSEPNTAFAIVDEGPGLSGSSFGSVADFLEQRGVEPRRIHFFPSHPGDLGPDASARHRTRWNTARRHVVSFEQLIAEAPDPSQRLERWAEDLIGSATEPVVEFSGGAWRKCCYPSEAQWPPANPQQERRKYLMRSITGEWLLKFAGLGRYGEEKLAIARVLAQADFTPHVAGLRHGFLIERWVAEARALDPHAFDRERLIHHLGRYLGFRARHLPAARPGASPETLWTMAARNAGLVFGDQAARALDRWKARLPGLARHVRPIRGDNRLHAWEWLVVEGRLIKSDALDHHAAHDLVGCQDLAWDIAGATIEFGLRTEECDRLCAVAEREAGQALVPKLIDFLKIAYLGFQLGSYVLAARANAHEPGEAMRLRAQAGRYSEALRHSLWENPAL
jgi:hypothetical protein